MNRRLTFALHMFVLAALVAACGGERAGEPTALPPDVARPAQPTPVFENSARVFRLTPPPTIPANAASVDASETLAMLSESSAASTGSQAHSLLRTLMVEQPPTALGIVLGQTALRAKPDGAITATLFGGETVTVTGRAQDGRYIAVFTAAGVPGWIASTTAILYGADDLTVVDRAIGPGPVVTLIAEAMEPLETSVLDTVMPTMP